MQLDGKWTGSWEFWSLSLSSGAASVLQEIRFPASREGVKSDFRKELTQEIMTYPMVLGCHGLMVHDYGPGKRYASIHVEFDKDDNLRACHEVVDQIERKCLEEYGTNLVIHLDPVITDDVEINRMQKLVRQCLADKDSRLAMHDFRMHSCDAKTNEKQRGVRNRANG